MMIALQTKILYCCGEEIEDMNPFDAFIEGVNRAIDYSTNLIGLLSILIVFLLGFLIAGVFIPAKQIKSGEVANASAAPRKSENHLHD